MWLGSGVCWACLNHQMFRVAILVAFMRLHKFSILYMWAIRLMLGRIYNLLILIKLSSYGK